MAVARTRSIDTPPKASVFWRPPEPSFARSGSYTDERFRDAAVVSGDPLLGRPNRSPGRVVQGYPIQLAKVQRPPLRAATLRRQRLNGWLDEHASRRVIFVSAEAGYGKTTLLADWARHARLRVLWYRIDDEDANWVAFAHYLVAAGRELDPAFAPRTVELLGAQPGEVAHDTVAAAFVAELPALANAGRVLFVLDDYHLVDHVPEIRDLMKLVISRAPSSMSFLLAGRRPPSVPVSRLRTMGEVAELRNDDLRFQLTETADLFRETYGRQLEADVIEDVNRRTEGWAASLQLVSAAVRDRSPAETRTFVRSLTGAKGDLYDYLAEEVVADLDPAIQAFLMRTSILQVVDPELAAIVTGLSADEVAHLISTTETLGLLGRRGQHAPEGHRYHPLVREFLEARFRAEQGADAVVAAHRKVAAAAEDTNWRDAAFHYAAAGSWLDVQRVLVDSAATIMASGEFDVAASYAEDLGPELSQPVFDLYHSRIELRRGDLLLAVERAEAAYRSMQVVASSLSYLAAANLATINYLAGRFEAAHALALSLKDDAPEPTIRSIARAIVLTLEVSLDGPIYPYVRQLEEMEVDHRRTGMRHYLAVTLLNRSVADQTVGDAEACLTRATEAVGLLQDQPLSAELAAARLARAWALWHLGRVEEARLEMWSAIESTNGLARTEALVEAANLAVRYGSQEEASQLVSLARHSDPISTGMMDVVMLVECELLLRQGLIAEAASKLQEHGGPRLSMESAHEARRRVLLGRVASCSGASGAIDDIDEALEFAQRQGAIFHLTCLQLLRASVGTKQAFDSRVSVLGRVSPAYLSVVAEAVVGRLHDLETATLQLVASETEVRPDRWRDALRNVIRPGHSSAVRAALLLEKVGTATDVSLLRRAARTLKGPGASTRFGRDLARRLAPQVFVEDQGRLQVRVGDVLVPDDDVRRKVFAVLCFLLTRPALSATRDEVIDAVWPEVDPNSAANSLNQTLYFLRRVIEPSYQDELSPNYVHHTSDVVWMDEGLVDSRSRLCGRLIERISQDGQGGDAAALAREYRGKFALDFAYEDWATSYRENAHAAYLGAIEAAIVAKIRLGEPAHAIALARRALQIDPGAEQLERLLLGAYHLAGSHAAVNEQYAHYAAYLRDDLGLDPPALKELLADDLGSALGT